MQTASPRAVLAVTSFGTALVLFAFTVPVATLTSTALALGAGASLQAWILSAMSVGAASGLLTSGAIGDDYGRRRVFILGAVLLAAGSLLGALAPTALVLVIARIVQGLGGAALIACGLGLIRHVYGTGPKLARAAGVWAAALGAGVAVGPALSAGLDVLAGWRLPYWLTAAGALASAVAARAWLPESRAAVPRRVDVAGALTLGLGLAAVLAALTEARSGLSAATSGLSAAGLAMLGAFVAVERATKDPMLDLALFRRADFVGATLTALAAGAGVLSLLSLIPTLLVRALGVGPIAAAAVLMVWSGTSVIAAYGARWLPAWLTPRAQLTAGLVGVALGQLALLGLAPESSIVRLLSGLFVCGVANGVLNAALGHEAVASVPPERSAMGSGANNTARYVGSATGLTIVTMLVVRGAGAGAEGLLSGWSAAVLVTSAFSLLGAVVSLRRGHASRDHQALAG